MLAHLGLGHVPLSLIGAARVGFALYRHGHGIFAADVIYQSIVGRPLAQLLGMSMAMLTHPDDRPCNAWLLEQAQRSGEAVDVRNRYLLKDGGFRWVENRVTPLSCEPTGALLLVASREVDGPRVEPSAPGDSMQEYIVDLTGELALMARARELGLGGELLQLAASSLDAGREESQRG